MPSSSADKQVEQLRRHGGYTDLPELGLVEITGEDAGKFLQFRTTNDVLGLQSGQGHLNTILDRTAHLGALFSIHRLHSTYWLLISKHQIESLIKQMEQFHFTEKVEFIDRSSQGLFWSAQGPDSPLLLAKVDPLAGPLLQSENDVAEILADKHPLLCIRKTVTGDDGFLFWSPLSDSSIIQSLTRAACALQFTALGPEALNIARIEAGIPCYGIDIDADDLLPDTGLEQTAVSYTKGCYLGQEVIARIKTYSAPRKGLMGVLFSKDTEMNFPLNTKLLLESKEIGVLKSNTQSPTLERTIALAYLLRDYRVPDQHLTVSADGQEYAIQTTLLPFYKPAARKDRAKQLYEQGLDHFASGNDQLAIDALREALALDPALADGYEALGVILSRQDQLEEAIDLMKQLAKIDTESIMAHANLSVFYMQQGNKDAAEEEKAIAMSIRMAKLAREMHAEKEQEEDQERKRQETIERIDMFKQVLDIDSEDLLANNGLGSIYVELGEFEKSLPFLQKAILVKPTHTVAYLALAEAFAGLGNKKEAIEVYKQGISVAGKRGDMTPLKEMQSRLQQLESGAPSTSQ